jgi:hypothetical protein
MTCVIDTEFSCFFAEKRIQKYTYYIFLKNNITEVTLMYLLVLFPTNIG